MATPRKVPKKLGTSLQTLVRRRSFARAHAVEISLLSQILKTRFPIIPTSLTEDRKTRDAAFRYEYNLILG